MCRYGRVVGCCGLELVRRFRDPTAMNTKPITASGTARGSEETSIVAVANAIINPPTSIIAVPRLGQVTCIRQSCHTNCMSSSRPYVPLWVGKMSALGEILYCVSIPNLYG
jgi:hypothetical protein